MKDSCWASRTVSIIFAAERTLYLVRLGGDSVYLLVYIQFPEDLCGVKKVIVVEDSGVSSA